MNKLLDISSTFRPRPWSVHMRNTRKLADLYLRLYNNTGLDIYLTKYMRLKGCSNFIEFNDIDSMTKILHRVFFCRVRLCPLCQWRRSLYIFQQFLRVSSYALSRRPLRFLFMTLTCKNVDLASLDSLIHTLFSAWSKFTSLKRYKDSVLGSFKTFEITYNSSEDTYHPHFHCILAVTPSYFKKKYISHKEWVSMWRKALSVSYDPLLNVRVVRPSRKDNLSDLFFDMPLNPLVRAAAELSKYSLKINDCILNNNDPLSALHTFDTVMHNRRFLSYTGFLRESYQALGELDSDQADLVHTGISSSSGTVNIVRYVWRDDYQNYFSV